MNISLLWCKFYKQYSWFYKFILITNMIYHQYHNIDNNQSKFNYIYFIVFIFKILHDNQLFNYYQCKLNNIIQQRIKTQINSMQLKKQLPHQVATKPITPIFNLNSSDPNSLQTTRLLKTTEAPLISILSMLAIQILFYSIPIYIVYLVFTMNWHMLCFLSLISLLQHLLIKKKSKMYVDFVNKYLKVGEYVNIQRLYDGDRLDSQAIQGQKTLFCYHPHGVFGYGIMLNNNNVRYPNQKLSHSNVIGSNFALSLPIIGAHLKLWGITGADTANFKSLLKNSQTVSLLPGGFQEATLTTPSELRVYINSRKGFIKYALKYGYTIRQVLVLNEHKIFWTFDYLLNLRLMLNMLKIPGVVYWSRWGLFLPPNAKITTIVGKPLRRSDLSIDSTTSSSQSQNTQPTNQQVQQFHKIYVKQLVQFYGRYKHMNENSQIKVY